MYKGVCTLFDQNNRGAGQAVSRRDYQPESSASQQCFVTRQFQAAGDGALTFFTMTFQIVSGALTGGSFALQWAISIYHMCFYTLPKDVQENGGHVP